MRMAKSLNKHDAKSASVVPPRALHSLLSLAAENHSAKIPTAIARAVANTMLAEVCFLISIPDRKGNITVFEGFNLSSEEMLEGCSISSSSKPALADKLKTSQPYWSNEPVDVSDFFSHGSKKIMATICMSPLITAQREPIGGIILLSPFSHRVWNRQDLIQLTAMVDTIARILQRVDYLASLEEKLAQLTATHTTKPNAGEQSDLLESHLPEKEQALTSTTAEISTGPDAETGDEQSVSQIRNEVEHGWQPEKVSDLISDYQKLQDQPKQAASNLAVATGGPYAIANDMSETESMRSAISAISGYIQLMRSESAGPLTPMQKKFLERVQVSAGKISLALTSLEKSAPHPVQGAANQKVAFKPVIKEVLFEFGTLIDQKEIKVELAIPKDLPDIFSNEENITKVLKTVLSSILFEAPPNGKLIVLLKSVRQVKSRGGILCSIISMLQGPDIKAGYIPVVSDYELEREVSPLLSEVNGQVWVNQSIRQERTIHLFFADSPM